MQVLVTISQFRHDLRHDLYHSSHCRPSAPLAHGQDLRLRQPAQLRTRLLARAEQISDNNPFIELRLDTLNKPQAILPKLRSFTSTNRHVTVIATCRRTEGGGDFVGELFEQAEILEGAAKAGCQLIDVEIESAETMRPADWKRLRASGAALILSYHDFSHTRSLEKAFERMQRLRS